MVTKRRQKKIKNLYFEYAGESFNADEIVTAVKADWVAMGNKVKDMADAKIYVKPEDNKAYYVVNEVTYSIDLK